MIRPPLAALALALATLPARAEAPEHFSAFGDALIHDASTLVCGPAIAGMERRDAQASETGAGCAYSQPSTGRQLYIGTTKPELPGAQAQLSLYVRGMEGRGATRDEARSAALAEAARGVLSALPEGAPPLAAAVLAHPRSTSLLLVVEDADGWVHSQQSSVRRAGDANAMARLMIEGVIRRRLPAQAGIRRTTPDRVAADDPVWKAGEGATVHRLSGATCPDALGRLGMTLRRVETLRPDGTDIACQFGGDDGLVTFYVTDFGADPFPTLVDAAATLIERREGVARLGSRDLRCSKLVHLPEADTACRLYRRGAAGTALLMAEAGRWTIKLRATWPGGMPDGAEGALIDLLHDARASAVR